MSGIFFHHANIIIKDYQLDNTDVVVFNRYYFGEWVYGQLYRHENPDEIKAMIQSVEHYLLAAIDHNDIYYLQLLSSSASLLKNNDDGESLSNADIHKIDREISLFEEVYGFSVLKKKMVYVNDGDRYRNQQDILNEVNLFIQA